MHCQPIPSKRELLVLYLRFPPVSPHLSVEVLELVQVEFGLGELLAETALVFVMAAHVDYEVVDALVFVDVVDEESLQVGGVEGGAG